jgi:hypothetical protein
MSVAPSPNDGAPPPSSGGGGGAPGFVVPPKPGGAKKDEWNRFKRFLRNLGGRAMLRWADEIWRWGKHYKVPPAILAALIHFESKGDPNAVSGDGAVGLGQIMPEWVGNTRIPGADFVLKDPRNPIQNIRFTAMYFRYEYEQHGSWWNAYVKGYNKNDPNRFAFKHHLQRARKFMGTGSAGPPTGLSPGEQAEGQAQQAVNQDPWVVMKDGKPRFVNSLEPPKNAVKMFGIPVSRSQFLQAWHSHYDPIFLAYIGRRAKPGEVAHLLLRGLSDYQLINRLSKRPEFFKSETWKSRAGQYQAISTDIVTKDYKVDKELVRKAIVHNWSGETFAQKLRELPEYQFGNEFQSKSVDFLSQLGMVTGGIATLKPTDNAKPKNKEGLNLYDPVLQKAP